LERTDWDERYSSEELVWSAEPNRFLATEVEYLPPVRALDLGSGEGRNAIWLAERGWQVTGVDFSAVALAKARRLATSRGVKVEWIEADLRGYAPPVASFDLVVILYLHLTAEYRRTVVKRAAAALAPRGTILVVGHDSTNLTKGIGGPQNPAVLFTPEDIVADLAGLHIERAERVFRSVQIDGREATAIDALVRAVKNGDAR
jgi:SAM-dependent methyltransferase